MLRPWLLPVILPLIGLASSTPAHATDRCKDILEKGFRNRFKLRRTESFVASTRRLLCERNDQSSGSDFRFGLSLPVLQNIIGADVTQENSSRRRMEYCSRQSEGLSSAQSYVIAKSTVDRGVVEVWERCMARTQVAVRCEATFSAPDLVAVDIYWSSGLAEAPEARLLLEPQVAGGSCEVMPKVGDQLVDQRGRPSLTLHCSLSKGRRSFSFALNTNQGAARCEYVAQPTPRELLAGCRSGRTAQCGELLGLLPELMQEVRQQCAGSADANRHCRIGQFRTLEMQAKTALERMSEYCPHEGEKCEVYHRIVKDVLPLVSSMSEVH